MTQDADRRTQAALGLEQLAALVRAQSWRQDGTHALTPTQSALLQLLHGTGDGLRAGQLAARLGISPASLSDTVQTLEARRWLRRTPDPDDRRASRLRLTAAGARAAAQARNGIGRLLDALDDADTGALLRVTQQLVQEAQRQGLATGLRTCLGCAFFRPFASGDGPKPHVCGFLGTAFGDAELRMDCTEQQPADAQRLGENALRFRATVPP